MYTVFSKPEETRGDWFLVDAAGKTLGRLASEIAHRLKGKHKPNYAPHQDLGDHIVVINAGTVRVTGAKLTDKIASRMPTPAGAASATKPPTVASA